ncbi:hypothetical protein PC116_g23058 [Phytophthora cactorum]|uniref:Uncharacterized protein n=1 Tax=Phytophthora cactorum TaxID=29920 RepID=A0A329RHX3_9STRA|nr:hypothetical protein Pcac1_g5752 [Phytophthora cactorum]KAG4228594.1 hypothetical protein PC116_g23058 [Phytophthora cactorum]RAW24020.1 hypothetical protein PC110_g19550 [Phytophthora cactorum]
MVCDVRYFSEYKKFGTDTADCVLGLKRTFATTPPGRGTVKPVVQKGALDMMLTSHDVFYVSENKNLLSHSQAEDKGHAVDYHGRIGSKMYIL